MGVLMVIPGVRLMVRHESRPRMIWGAAIVVVGLVPVTWCAWRVFHHVRQLQRIHMNLCAHCAYPTKGVRKGRCPECGKDPFEPG